MAVEAVFRDVKLASKKPLREGRPPIQNLPPLPPPEQIGGLIRPKLFGRPYRCRVELLVFSEGSDGGVFNKFFRGLEDAVFNKMGFNIITHSGKMRMLV